MSAKLNRKIRRCSYKCKKSAGFTRLKKCLAEANRELNNKKIGRKRKKQKDR